ncbi:MAG: hypothetical protein QOH06_3565 [Acidobacteriota bacterium]|jgi:hypothetical protein|nr:hypothetical protein [Acidobacteriota bacterium]
MFIGHFGVGFGAKRFAPAVSLGTLFLAAQFADLLWPTLLLLGVEQVRIDPGITVVTPLDFVHYPYSHSLIAMVAWGAVFGIVYKLARRSRPAIGLLLAALVVSHWVLDLVMHRPDLPLTVGGAERYGFGLWNSLPGTLAVELPLFLAGVFLYVRSTAPRDRTGKIALAGLVLFLLAVYFMNFFGSPPPSSTAVAWVTQSMWLLVAWGYWVDRHGQPREGITSRPAESRR